MIWPLSTSAICYSTLYYTPHTYTLHTNNNWWDVGNICGWKAFHIVMSSGISLPTLHSRDWEGISLPTMLQPLFLDIPPKCFLYVTPGVPPHDLHPPSMVLGGPHLDLRPVDLKLLKPKTSGVYICCSCVWKLYMAVKGRDTKNILHLGE